MKDFSKEELDKQQEIIDDFKQQFKTKSITFDKEAQDNLPQHIKDKMKADRENARKKQLTIHSVSDLLIAWEQFKKAEWWESEAIDVEKVLIDRFQAIYGR